MSAFQLEYVLMSAAGMAFAGVLAEAFHLISGCRVSFSLFGQGRGRAWLAAPLLFATGPFVLLRNNYRAYVLEGRPLRFVLAGAAVATVWALLTGFLLLGLAEWASG
ncbi:MAG TPA: hypothetical protein PK812_05640 [Beijerinckiaceae bacterium]|nr:hypothetical protein [Beijerinckiaceae bacterium]